MPKLKLGVSDEMIKRAIVSDPNLQSNGKFDNALSTIIDSKWF